MFEGRPSIFKGRHINHRSSKVDTSIIDLRRSAHRSSKANTSISESRHINLRRSTHQSSIFEGRHIDVRKSTHRSSIFENRRRKHRTYNLSPNIVYNCAPKSLVLVSDEVIHTHTYMYNYTATRPPHEHKLCVIRLFILRICASRRGN